MSSEDLERRLEQEPVQVECPICRHRQWLHASSGRCGQCGSEIALFGQREPAESALAELVAGGRVAYLVRAGGLHAVIANRSFGRGTDR